jgi:type IV secretory pathway TraG/TraD family ATPase VirD4
MSDDDLTFLGRTTFRNERKLFGIRRADRRHHLYLIGKSGTGKSTLLETMIRQDIVNGEGVAVLDPHGELVEMVLQRIPDDRKNDVIYLDPSDKDNGVRFNPLGGVPPERQAVAAAGLLEAFKKIWSGFWGPRTEHLLRNAFLALMEVQQGHLAHVLKMYVDRNFRQQVALRLRNEYVRQFWLNEYESYPARLRADAIAPIQNKVGAFVSNPFLAKVLLHQRSTFDLREVMDTRKILLANLAKGRIGEDAAQLLGSLLVSATGQAGLSRGEVAEKEQPDFYVFADEFHNFTTLSFASQLAELRKYRVSMTLAHQHLAQLDSQIRDAILGNVSSLICFRTGATDARILESEFSPEFKKDDFVYLPAYQMAARLLVKSEVALAFTAEALQLSKLPNSGE